MNLSKSHLYIYPVIQFDYLLDTENKPKSRYKTKQYTSFTLSNFKQQISNSWKSFLCVAFSKYLRLCCCFQFSYYSLAYCIFWIINSISSILIVPMGFRDGPKNYESVSTTSFSPPVPFGYMHFRINSHRLVINHSIFQLTVWNQVGRFPQEKRKQGKYRSCCAFHLQVLTAGMCLSLTEQKEMSTESNCKRCNLILNVPMHFCLGTLN